MVTSSPGCYSLPQGQENSPWRRLQAANVSWRISCHLACTEPSPHGTEYLEFWAPWSPPFARGAAHVHSHPTGNRSNPAYRETKDWTHSRTALPMPMPGPDSPCCPWPRSKARPDCLPRHLRPGSFSGSFRTRQWPCPCHPPFIGCRQGKGQRQWVPGLRRALAATRQPRLSCRRAWRVSLSDPCTALAPLD